MIKKLSMEFVDFVREIYKDEKIIPLHRPIFDDKEKKILVECIDSNFVSTTGKLVNKFEKKVQDFTGIKYAVSTVNGTAALHIGLKLLGVKKDDEVITQSLNFVASSNAISYCNARPVFIDVNKENFGMCPKALNNFLTKNATRSKGFLINKYTGNKISACLPLHVFGNPCDIISIKKVCDKFGLPILEDIAESLGSFVGKKHTGSFSDVSTLSFNGNKIITTGGGGMILTNNKKIFKEAKHITTTAKLPHRYEYIHDQVGFNYRMPNLNAALGCAQIQKIKNIIRVKRKIANLYKDFFKSYDIDFLTEDSNSNSNYWLNTIILKTEAHQKKFLDYTNKNGIMTRPLWRLMSNLKMYKKCQSDNLKNSKFLEKRVVNIPSSVPNIFNEK